LAKSSFDRRALDDLAGIHHRDLVADLGDHAEIVRDENDGGAARGFSSRIKSRICAAG